MVFLWVQKEESRFELMTKHLGINVFWEMRVVGYDRFLFLNLGFSVKHKRNWEPNVFLLFSLFLPDAYTELFDLGLSLMFFFYGSKEENKFELMTKHLGINVFWEMRVVGYDCFLFLNLGFSVKHKKKLGTERFFTVFLVFAKCVN